MHLLLCYFRMCLLGRRIQSARMWHQISTNVFKQPALDFFRIEEIPSVLKTVVTEEYNLLGCYAIWVL
jgi:hypothetical protein